MADLGKKSSAYQDYRVDGGKTPKQVQAKKVKRSKKIK